MKYIYIITISSFFLVGCTMNPSKEARIQKLERELAQTRVMVQQLEQRVQVLEESDK